jgi:hypothetical protein
MKLFSYNIFLKLIKYKFFFEIFNYKFEIILKVEIIKLQKYLNILNDNNVL